MRSTFRDVAASEFSADTSAIRGEINSFIDSSAHVDSQISDAAQTFNFRDFGNLIDDAIQVRDTFSHGAKAGVIEDTIRLQNQDHSATSSLDADTSPVKVASATTSTPVETTQATATQTLAKAAAVAPTTTLAAMSSAAAPAAATTAATSGFPDASNTGVASGTVMTKYTGSYHVTQDNAVISNLEVHGDIVIEAKNVTLKNVKLVSDTEWHALRVMDDATGFTLQDSEIDGVGGTVNAIYGFGTFLRNNLHDVENGINVIGPSVIKDNYIHDMRGGSEAHYDGIEINGGNNIDIIHNTVINDYSQTSAIMLDNYFGGLSNITVDGNRLVGGGYTVYLDDRFGGGAVDDSSIKITNNQIGDGYWGDFSLYGNKPVLSGNTDLDALPSTPTTPTTPTPPVTGTTYTGTEGNDTLPLSGKTDAGNETYKGMGGNDLLKGGAGADTLDGGLGTDTASYAGSTAVNVNLQTGAASGGHAAGDKFISIENLTGSSYGDTLTGNSANNVIDGGAGADKMAGGTGNDTYVVDNAGDVITEASNAGTDLVKASVSYTLATNVENLTLTGTGNINATGNSAVNTLTGNSGNNTLDGKAGVDKMAGGSGDDTYIVDNTGDVVTEGASAGTDLVKASVSHTLATNVEYLALTGTGNINGTGNSANNGISGNSGNNTLKGGAGSDAIIGGSGNDTLEGQSGYDTLTGGSGADKFMFRQSEVKTSGADHITDFGSGDLVVFDVTSGPTGNLSTGAFYLGTGAHDSTDRFIYDTAKHALYYDSDGTGSAAQVLVATFENGYTLSASDFLLV
ncbi:Ca2+-binding RTX toxin-like protein [Pararhizobium capsulatum DSM 1112]|uniref:Ca2+-binding RTX toxin-like protein n=1 Tax=Pararhizobium capsulatum DSM 1112 TaxID=1121113 RepID=A0ABU0BW48_9HYPH|nr:calcium-binding protein [Pararhizobium capsulatum]MDQ0322172.1 Ca2+-binding RTX toxin-like protein [Pararhizobium capsulatum DSM 1112]